VYSLQKPLGFGSANIDIQVLCNIFGAKQLKGVNLLSQKYNCYRGFKKFKGAIGFLGPTVGTSAAMHLFASASRGFSAVHTPQSLIK